MNINSIIDLHHGEYILGLQVTTICVNFHFAWRCFHVTNKNDILHLTFSSLPVHENDVHTRETLSYCLLFVILNFIWVCPCLVSLVDHIIPILISADAHLPAPKKVSMPQCL